MPAEAPLPAEVLAWLERVDARWRATDVDVGDRLRMGADLVDDLRAALAGGADPVELTAEGPDVFADKVATAARDSDGAPHLAATRPALAPRAVALTGVVGGAVGGLAVWLFFIPMIGAIFFAAPASPGSETVAILLIYLVSGGTVVGCILGAIAWRFRDDPRTRRLLWFVAGGVIAFGAASIAPAIGLAWIIGYSTSAGGLVVVGGLVLAFVAAGIRAGQWLAERKPPDRARLLVRLD